MRIPWIGAVLAVAAGMGLAEEKAELLFRVKGPAGARDEVVETVQQRLKLNDIGDSVVKPSWEDGFAILVEDREGARERIRKLVLDPGTTEFRITVEPSAPNYERYWRLFRDRLKEGVDPKEAATLRPEDVARGDDYPRGLRWYRLGQRAREKLPGWEGRLPRGEDGSPRPWILCAIDEHDVGGQSLQYVRHHRDTSAFVGGWSVSFEVKEEWRDRFADLTRLDGQEKYLAIIRNSEVDAAPRLRSQLSGSGMVQGNFTEAEARAVAVALAAGPLGHPVELVAERLGKR